LAYLSYEDVKDYIGNPYSTPEDIRLANYDSKKHQPEPTLIYLGIDETTVPPVVDAPGQEIAFKYPGTAYFSLDVTPENQSPQYEKKADEIIERAKDKGLEFLTVRIGVSLSREEAPIVAMARSFTDWNLRNKFCPACGRRTSTPLIEIS
jgi:NAD+ diphosphatase